MQYNLHSNLFGLSWVWLPLVFYVGLSGIVLFLCRIWRPDLHAAGVWAFAASFVLTFIAFWATQAGSVLAVILLGLITGIILVLVKTMATLGARATRSLNIAGVVLLLEQSGRSLSLSCPPQLPVPQMAIPFVAATQLSPPSVRPSIFHIVMDAYSRDDVLWTVYGVDNRHFHDGLEELGFHVFADAHAPFNQTLISMASVFSGAYLEQEELQNRYSDLPHLHRGLGRFLDNGAVPVWLRRLGYRMAASTTGYQLFGFRNVDRWEPNSTREANLFALALYGASPFGWFDRQLLADSVRRWLFQYPRSDIYLNRIVRSILSQGAPDGLPTPYLVYRHVLAPHPPFTLDRTGQDVASEQFFSIADGDHAHRNSPELRAVYVRGYVDKLSFVNRELLTMLNRIVATAARPFIIFLHGDHGGGVYLSQESMTNTCLKERFSVLMAVYASDPELQRDLVDSLKQAPNPVNFYRALYNALYQVNHPMLPDQSWFATWSNAWSFTPVPPDALNAECTTK